MSGLTAQTGLEAGSTVIPAKAGIQFRALFTIFGWIPAFAGMTAFQLSSRNQLLLFS
jgi:hypothetical protein